MFSYLGTKPFLEWYFNQFSFYFELEFSQSASDGYISIFYIGIMKYFGNTAVQWSYVLVIKKHKIKMMNGCQVATDTVPFFELVMGINRSC